MFRPGFSVCAGRALVYNASMTLEILILLILLVGMAFFFFTEKLPVDLTAFLGLVILILTGYLAPSEAFTGFASPAVITMLSIFFVSGALLHTGIADLVGTRIHRLLGSREVPLMIAIMLVTGLLSAFMINIAAAAVMLPAVASLARKAKICPSRLFMPLSFGAILGGTTTLVGTPPNILAAEMLVKRDLAPFSLFDFTALGTILLAAGILYMVTLGRKLLPTRNIGNPHESDNLSEMYELRQNLFSIKIPADSQLAGKTLKEARLGAALGIQILAINRKGKKRLAPKSSMRLQAQDTLIVKGPYGDLDQLFRIQRLNVAKTNDAHFQQAREQIRVLTAAVAEGSAFIGQAIGQIWFRERFNVFVVAIRRAGELLERDIAREPIQKGDELLIAIGNDTDQSKIADQADFAVSETQAEVLNQLRKHIFVLHVPADSSLVTNNIGDLRIGELVGLSIVGLIRKRKLFVNLKADQQIEADDELFVTGERERIKELLSLGNVDLQRADETALESDEVGVIEATLTPRSGAAGRTLSELNFRERHQLQVLAIWREGRPIHSGLADIPLRFGDALLLQGTWDRIHLFGANSDFMTLSESVQEPRRTNKAAVAVGALVVMVALVVSGWQPIHVAAFVAATMVVLGRAITMEEAYRSVEWRAIFLVAAVLPVGIAMERTGAAMLISETVTNLVGPLGPYAILAGLFCLSSLLSQCLDGAPAVVLLAPVAMQTADQIGVSPYTTMMGISLAASMAFMTPFSSKANLLVMGAGGYSVKDYLKVGTPLTILMLILLVVLVPIFFPI